MNTETRLEATHDQCAELIRILVEKKAKAKETGERQYAVIDLELPGDCGPWRLKLCVLPPYT